MDEIQGYETYLTTEKKASDNTLCSYLRDVRQFAAYCEREGLVLTQVGQPDVEGYLRSLTSRGKSVATVTRAAASLKSFYGYLIRSGKAAANPARGVAPAKVERKLPQILTSKEVELFLEQPERTDPKGCRDHAMLELLYATGIRVSELIDLNVDDLNLSGGFLRCAGKGRSKERIIPLYAAAIRALTEYLRDVRPQLLESADEPALFVNMTGKRMSRQGFWKIIKTYAQQAQIHKPITPHTIRHSFAAHLLENGADIHDIQEILGHADLSSTQRYAHFLKERMQASYMKFHPRA